MKAGRELDALVAEKVMGLEVSSDRNAATRAYLYLASRTPRYMEDIPPYSSNIAAAWEVAQKVRDLDEDNEFIIHLSEFKHNECTVEIKFWDYTNPSDPVLAGPFYVVADTAPLAICLAALKAVGHK